MEIYQPREDSILLERNVKKYAKGRVLDVGTGSGIQAAAALEKADEVIGVDINPAAVKYCKGKYSKIFFLVSDLFENVSGKFDTIIFNPPYLPEDPSAKDVALDGGKEGWELIDRFLREVRGHLDENGVVLLLFSSLTGKEKVDSLIKENRFRFLQIDNTKLDFEELYVYMIEDDRNRK